MNFKRVLIKLRGFKMPNYYAVHVGRRIGVFKTYAECEPHVKGFDGAKFKKFDNEKDAHDFVENGYANINKRKLEEEENEPKFFEKKQKVNNNSSDIISTTADKDNTILNIYCDGSAFFNGKPNCKAGFAVFFGVDDKRNYSQQILDLPSNNRAELHAILKSLEIVTSNKDVSKYKKITIHSDSEYSIKSATLWIKGWKKNGWMTKANTPVEHKDLLKKN